MVESRRDGGGRSEDAACGSVLGRPIRTAARSLWSQLVSRIAHQKSRDADGARLAPVLIGGSDAVRTITRALIHKPRAIPDLDARSEEHTSELQSRLHLVCRLL